MVRWLDDGLPIPGTRLRVGLDPILGLLLPGAGDAITGIGSAALFLEALRARVPTVVLLRMFLNILVDVTVGSIPLAGDLFDAFWKSNRRNLELIERYREAPGAPPTARDYAVVMVAVLVLAAAMALPWVLLWLVGSWGASWIGG